MRTKSRTSERFIQQTWLVVALLLCLQPAALARGSINQEQNEVRELEPGRMVEREIAGGESHKYKFTLQAGQFVRVVVEQKKIDVALKIAAPDGEQLIEANFGEVGELESLSAEAAAGGEHQLTIRANGAAGSYRVRLEVKAAASAQDKQRMTAERLLVDVAKSFHQGAGALATTIEKARQALTLWRELGDRHWEAATANIIGQAYVTVGTSEQAIEALNQALGIRRELKYRTGEGITLLNLGGAYHTLGRYEKAIEYYEQALVIFRELKNRLAEGNTLYNLGDASGSLSRNEKAIEYYEQALAIQREVKNRRVEGYALGSMGNAYRNLGRYQKAIEYLEQELAINREVKDRSGEGYTLNNLGLAYSKMSRYEKATEHCEQALAIFREVKERDGEAAALYNLAQTERAQGSLPAARTHIEENLKLEEATRADIVTPESRTSFLATVQRSYGLYMDILMSQHRAEPTKGLDALAVETSERQRARSLLDLLTEARADLRRGVDAALIERERSLGKQLNDKARTQTSTPEQAAALKREISQLENDYEQAQSAIRKASPHYAALIQPQPLKLREIQAQLDADTLLLEYALGEERSYLWAITKASLTSYELPKGELIEKNARQVYELLTARSANKRGETAPQRQERISQAEAKLPAAAQELSRTLLAPVAAQLGNKRLVIVADGALQYIPLAMLPDPSVVNSQSSVAKGNAQPLIVNHEVISLPSASALAIQRSELAGRQLAPKMLAVIADPVFDRTDSRFTIPASETRNKTQTQTISGDDARSIEHLAEKSGDKAGVTTLRLVIPRLPFTRQEATRVLALAPKNSSFGAIDFQASRATALDPALGQYRYVHFATHGVLDTERPGLSALVLSMVDQQGKPQNGFLRANDIYNVKLPAELVVLSACQTGLGKEIKGEGLVGLTRGFMYAGAARVVVSLWNVNDKATADLMTKFYEKMLKQGARPAAALRAAQVEMWKQKQRQSPYYWAAFTMQGEWR
ncbi:MAG: CHAT domain-containing tetratricopeptide repeat protein [Pyrinomonadaceae bacterium]|nr:CHAT domain-containing tetratricopeptide repeat protein [Pyrinomonadaceae bacterium]